MIKKIGLSLSLLSSILFANNNLSTNNIISYIEKNGYPYNQEIDNTQNLVLIGKKVYIENNKKAILIEVQNKTSKVIDVVKEVGQGYAIPSKLGPFKKGYLIISNFVLSKPYKYDNNNIFDQLSKIVSTSSFYKIIPYMIKDPVILEFNSLTPTIKTFSNFKTWTLTKNNMVIYERVDRVIDENINRNGLYLSGFIKINKDLYEPLSIYFIVNNGKIVKIYMVYKLLNFKDFKTLILTANK